MIRRPPRSTPFPTRRSSDLQWRLVNGDPRLWGRDGDFNEVKVDPKNADVLYVANVVTWKSSDGGRSFTAFRGAPGGDRSEEHTSELQSRLHLVCRLLLEKKKKQ